MFTKKILILLNKKFSFCQLNILFDLNINHFELRKKD